jgi:hypothetical protein
MDSKLLYERIKVMKTSELLIAKMECTKTISFLKSIKLGVIAVLGLAFTDITTDLMSGVIMSEISMVSFSIATLSVIVFFVFDVLQSTETARKELMNDLLSIRGSRTGLTKPKKKANNERSVK